MSDARKMLAEALREEMTPEKAREIVQAGLNAEKNARVQCPNCGKNVPMGLVEDWEKRARFIQIIADQGLGKPKEAEREDPLEALQSEIAGLSDDELVEWLERGGAGA